MSDLQILMFLGGGLLFILAVILIVALMVTHRLKEDPFHDGGQVDEKATDPTNTRGDGRGTGW